MQPPRPTLAIAALLLAGTGPAPSAPATVPATGGATRCAAAPQQQPMWQDMDDDAVCRVVAFGPVPGTSPPLFYQLQSFDPPGTPTPPAPAPDGVGAETQGAGVVLLRPAPDNRLAVLAGWSGAEAWVEPPRLVRTRQGPILVVPMSATNSSHPTYDAVFRPHGGRWLRLETDSWSNAIRVPPGTTQRHGNAMDWPGLRAFGAFWKAADPECCATGGSYIARLRLDGTRLRLTGARYSHGSLPFP